MIPGQIEFLLFVLMPLISYIIFVVMEKNKEVYRSFRWVAGSLIFLLTPLESLINVFALILMSVYAVRTATESNLKGIAFAVVLVGIYFAFSGLLAVILAIPIIYWSWKQLPDEKKIYGWS